MLNWLKALLRSRLALPAEVRRAREIIAAIDAGGLPLNPGTINQVARNLGLEVSRNAAVEDTIQRLRAAVERRRH